MDWVIRFQPSIRMKRRIFRGRLMVRGGTIIMPRDIRMLATIRSTRRKGMKRMKPI